MNYEEFSGFKELQNDNNSFLRGYIFDDQSDFYIEPWFYTQMQRLCSLHQQRTQQIIATLFYYVNKYKHVVFTRDSENPLVDDQKYICVEIDDIALHLGIHVEDKSRGSDYGD